MIAVRQCGEVALPVPGMRQRMAAGKAEIIRKTVAAEMPAMQCLQLARAEQRRGATLIDGQTVAEKRKSYGSTIYAKGCSHEYRTCDNKSGPCRNSELAGGAGFQRLYRTLANRTTADDCGTGAGCAGGTVATNACGGCPLPPGAFGDELATRLAWRVHGASICQVISFDISTASVRKSHWGNALTATLQTEKRPLCLSLARQAGADKNATLPSGMQQLNIVPGALPDWLISVENLKNVTRDPLAEARRVLVVGQGGEADNQEIAMLAEKMGVEVGYSRARVMNGGVDAEKVIGISGHLLAPEVCIVVGASGAAALMAGVRNSKFVVAINHDASAAVFSQADVGVVDDWKAVLEALVTTIHADCQ